MAGKARGLFAWHELHTPDARAGAAFYGKVTGWTAKGWEEDPSYLVLSAGTAQMAGAQTLSPDARRRGEAPRWLPYIATDDVEVAVWEAQRLGGKVTKDTESVPSIGKFAVLQDPYGAEFAVIQPAYVVKSKHPEPVGDFSWHELVTEDIAGSFRFYSALFGWEKTTAEDMGPPVGMYQMYGWKDRNLGGIYRRTREEPGPHRWRSYIKVRDAKAAADAATRAGAKILAGPMQVPGGDWIVMAVDPQGAEFALHAVKAKKKPVKKPRKPARKRAPTRSRR
jgi:predicted enzyme related to lactoylglutathione lyase